MSKQSRVTSEVFSSSIQEWIGKYRIFWQSYLPGHATDVVLMGLEPYQYNIVKGLIKRGKIANMLLYGFIQMKRADEKLIDGGEK